MHVLAVHFNFDDLNAYPQSFTGPRSLALSWVSSVSLHVRTASDLARLRICGDSLNLPVCINFEGPFWHVAAEFITWHMITEIC